MSDQKASDLDNVSRHTERQGDEKTLRYTYTDGRNVTAV